MVACLHMPELSLDQPERVFDGCADRRLDVFDLFGQIAQGLILDRLDLAAFGRDVPLASALGWCMFLSADVAGVA